MKTKNLKTKKFTLLHLHLIKFQAYKQKNLCFNSLNLLELKIKQILQIIALYHSNKKRILFIGFPYINNKNILKYSKHTFIPKNVFSNGSFVNKTKYSSLVKTSDLSIIFNPTKKEFFLFKEFYSKNKPLIVLGNSFFNNKINHKITYNAFGFNTRKYVKQFCSFLIFTILKQPTNN